MRINLNPRSGIVVSVLLSVTLIFYTFWIFPTTYPFLPNFEQQTPAPPPIPLTPFEPKYFHEPGVGDIFGHYDLRFYQGVIDDSERILTLRNLIRAYLLTMKDLGIKTWLAHGTLLGWYWNEKVLPWDTDLDVQVYAESLATLATRYNMTTYSRTETETAADGSSTEVRRKYLLDINPSYTVHELGNWMNVIDGRFVDVSNGLFIDITSLKEVYGRWADKCCHSYLLAQLEPLHETTFEGVAALVPHGYTAVLKEEYREPALVNTRFAGHSWDDDAKLWVKDSTKRAPEPPL